MSQPETRFKERVQRDLEKIPRLWTIKTQERARKGVPDLIICAHGMFLALELKIDGEKPTALQGYVMQEIKKAGGVAQCVTPSTWPQVLEAIRQACEA